MCGGGGVCALRRERGGADAGLVAEQPAADRILQHLVVDPAQRTVARRLPEPRHRPRIRGVAQRGQGGVGGGQQPLDARWRGEIGAAGCRTAADRRQAAAGGRQHPRAQHRGEIVGGAGHGSSRAGGCFADRVQSSRRQQEIERGWKASLISYGALVASEQGAWPAAPNTHALRAHRLKAGRSPSLPPPRSDLPKPRTVKFPTICASG